MSDTAMTAMIGLAAAVLSAGGTYKWLESQLEERTAELSACEAKLVEQTRSHTESFRAMNATLESCRAICEKNRDPAGTLMRSAPREVMPDVAAPPPSER